MDLNVKYYEREVYDFFAYIGDCGGLFGGLVSIFATLLGLVNFCGNT